MPTLTQLEYFVAVCKLGHFGRAAKNCHVSQPSLSIQIKNLEDELGAVLLDREVKPIRVTPVGQRIYEKALDILSISEGLKDITEKSSEVLSGEFKLGIIPTVASSLVPRFLPEFIRKYPHVNIVLKEITTQECVSQLRSRDIDAAVLATPLSEKGIHETPLYYENFLLYSASNHPYFGKKSIKSNMHFDTESIWVLEEGHCFRNQMLNVCNLNEARSAERKVTFECGSLTTLVSVVDSMGGYSFIPQLYSGYLNPSQRKRLREFTSPKPTREISIVYASTVYREEIRKALANEIIESVKSLVSVKRRSNFEVVDF